MATILVVEDEPALRATMCELLQHVGHVALEAGNGHEALTVLDRTPVDAVVLDITMPVLDGTAVLAAMPHGPKVIVHTAMGESLRDELRSRFDHRICKILRKPTPPDVFLKTIEGCLVG